MTEPLRPPISPPDAMGIRLIGLVIAGACLAVLLVAAWVHADSDGHGTHTQLGLPRCNWVSLFDLPCPTCGMTTAFAHAADGDLVSSARAQPMGSLLAIGSAVVFWGGLHVALAGIRPARFGGRVLGGKWWIAAMGIFIGSWVYKVVTWTS